MRESIDDPNFQILTMSGTEESLFKCTNYLRDLEDDCNENLINIFPHHSRSTQNGTVNNS